MTLTYRGVQYEKRDALVHYLLSKKEAELRLQKELSRDKDVNLSRLITRPD